MHLTRSRLIHSRTYWRYMVSGYKSNDKKLPDWRLYTLYINILNKTTSYPKVQLFLICPHTLFEKDHPVNQVFISDTTVVEYIV